VAGLKKARNPKKQSLKERKRKGERVGSREREGSEQYAATGVTTRKKRKPGGWKTEHPKRSKVRRSHQPQRVHLSKRTTQKEKEGCRFLEEEKKNKEKKTKSGQAQTNRRND